MQKRFLWLAVGAMLGGTSLYAQESAPGSATSALRLDSVDDPMLVRIVEAALRDHPQVLAAEAGLDREQALARAASRPLFNPELELDLESSDVDDKTLRLTQTLDVAGRRRARVQVAETQLEATARRVALSRRDLAVELLSALGAYWTARDLTTLAEQRLELLERVADVAEQRARVGDATQADLNLANLARAQARMDRARTAAELGASEQVLEAIVAGEPASPRPALPTNLPEIDVDRAELEQLVADVPEVGLQRQALEVAVAEVTLRERETRPTPSLSLIGGEEDNESLIGLGFSMPLNVRNRFRAEVDAARAEQQRAEREVDNVTLRALAAAEAATARYELVREAWAAWLATGAINLTQQTELLERLWRAGELSLTDYLVQVNQTLDTQQSAVELRQQLWDAWFSWLAATGQTGDWLGVPVETAETSGR